MIIFPEFFLEKRCSSAEKFCRKKDLERGKIQQGQWTDLPVSISSCELCCMEEAPSSSPSVRLGSASELPHYNSARVRPRTASYARVGSRRRLARPQMRCVMLSSLSGASLAMGGCTSASSASSTANMTTGTPISACSERTLRPRCTPTARSMVSSPSPGSGQSPRVSTGRRTSGLRVNIERSWLRSRTLAMPQF